jgi:hypothetical protein
MTTSPTTAATEAVLVLEDGRIFRGRSYGAVGETFGEAVFNTGMTGYQETLTDPSYHRQVVVMTAPHIGNTGVNDEDPESKRIWVSGYVVRDPARRPSNWRSVRTLDDELAGQGVVGISRVDTRALTRHLRERALEQLNLRGGRGRVAGPVGEEQAVRADREHVVQRAGRGQHVHLDPARRHHRRGHRLDAEVQRGDHERRLAPGHVGGGHDVRLGRRDLAGQLGAGHRRGLAHPGQQRRRVGLDGGDADPHRAALAQVAGQRAGVDAGDPHDALGAQLVVEAAPRAPAGRHPRGVAHDVARDPEAVGLAVLVVDAGVADVRRGHHHDLAVVGRVGQRLLVAGHAGVEDGLAEGLARGAVGPPAEGPAVLEHEEGVAPGAHAGFPSSTVGVPRRNVATTRPGSSRPAYGVLRESETDSLASTVRRAAGS